VRGVRSIRLGGAVRSHGPDPPARATLATSPDRRRAPAGAGFARAGAVSALTLSVLLALARPGEASVRDRAADGNPAAPPIARAVVRPVPGGGVALAEPELDLGTVAAGERGRGTIVLVNRGTADRRLRDVRPACGCTTVEAFAPVSIPPGGAVAFAVTMAGPDEPGATRTRTVTWLVEGQAPLETTLILRAAAGR